MDKETIQKIMDALIGPIEEQVSGQTLRAAIELVFQPEQEKPGQDALSDGARSVFVEALNIARCYASASPSHRCAIKDAAESARLEAVARFSDQFGGGI